MKNLKDEVLRDRTRILDRVWYPTQKAVTDESLWHDAFMLVRGSVKDRTKL
jgi:hypothetical protein